MSMPEESEYLLGTDTLEMRRLEQQHLTWQDEMTAMLAAAEFPEGGSFLDLGAGPGFTTVDLARITGTHGKVTAVDLSSRFRTHVLEMAERLALPQIEFLQGDVLKVELEPASLDGVLARWLFCFVNNPAALVRRIGEILKPGSSLAIMDYVNYLAVGFKPRRPVLETAFKQIHRSFRDSGGNLDIGDTLPALLQEHGFEMVSFEPIVRYGFPQSPYWNWYKNFRHSYFPKLEDAGYLSQSELIEHDRAIEELEQRPGSFLFTPPMFRLVARKR